MANKLTISTAESCSGGLLATLLSDAAGSSAYFIGSVVAYSDRVKIDVLGVPEDTIHDYGAVSEQAALAMLSGAYQLFHTDICCSITGIAGPNGGSTDKPVGTVYIGVKYQSINTVTRYTFAGDRDQIRHSAVEKAMTMILDMIKGV
jgi:PncC family amidohydrolase